MTSKLLRVIDEITDEWLQIPGVVGIAPGPTEETIVVGVTVATEEVEDRLPEEHQGYPVVVEEWGSISAGG